MGEGEGRDAAMPDDAMPDGAMPDDAMPDGALPDAALSDAAMSDAARATMLVLLAVRLGGSTPTTGVLDQLDRLGVTLDDPAGLLDRLELAGLVAAPASAQAPARWRLTDDGRAEGQRLLRLDAAAHDAVALLDAAYAGFLTMNGELLHVCAAWQLRDLDPAHPIVNDHLDPDHDAAVLDRLDRLHDAVLPLTERLAAGLDRFARYGERFVAAHTRVRAGDLAALDGAGGLEGDSYHAIWFELHEHLLASVGGDRSAEPLPQPWGAGSGP